MSRTVEVIGGPKDGQRYSFEGDALVIPELSSSMAEWLENEDPTIPMPTMRLVRYSLAEWHGRLFAIHPEAAKP